MPHTTSLWSCKHSSFGQQPYTIFSPMRDWKILYQDVALSDCLITKVNWSRLCQPQDTLQLPTRVGSPTIRREGDKLRPGSACKLKDLLQTSSLQDQLDSRLCSTVKGGPKVQSASSAYVFCQELRGISHVYLHCCSFYCFPMSCHMPPHSWSRAWCCYQLRSGAALQGNGCWCGRLNWATGAVLCPSHHLKCGKQDSHGPCVLLIAVSL